MTDPDGRLWTFRAILDRARAGENDAREELARRFLPIVRQDVHRRLTLDHRRGRPWLLARFSTGDIVQEVLLGVLDDLTAFQGDNEQALAGYLSMVTRNRIVDVVRYHEAARRDGRRGASLPEDSLIANADDPLAVVMAEERRERLEVAMADLQERERLLVRARFEETASFAELTERLGYSSESVARRAYFSAQAFLAVRLVRLGEDEA